MANILIIDDDHLVQDSLRQVMIPLEQSRGIRSE
jgi:hypothetical protein